MFWFFFALAVILLLIGSHFFAVIASLAALGTAIAGVIRILRP
jgi:hypothetical protein